MFLNYNVFAYPFDVIKTNRIVQSQLCRETGDNLPREFVALYERGALASGFYRGLVPMYAGSIVLGSACYSDKFDGFRAPVILAALGLLNPLEVMTVKRQIVQNTEISYASLWKTLNYRMFTLGLGSHALKTAALFTGLIPGIKGSKDEASYALFAFGGVLVSHPFEVAKVLIMHQQSGWLVPTLQSLYASQGVAGLYRGFIPRAAHQVPLLWSLNYLF